MRDVWRSFQLPAVPHMVRRLSHCVAAPFADENHSRRIPPPMCYNIAVSHGQEAMSAKFFAPLFSGLGSR